MMKERPILFSGPMVRAILDGRKTMTRRVMKPQPQVYYSPTEPEVQRMKWRGVKYRPASCAPCPYGQPGDRLWVRETWGLVETPLIGAIYKTDWVQDDSGERDGWWRGDHFHEGDIEWKPSIHMPRWASRITLEITDVRVERLKDITVEDAQAEGVTPLGVEGDGRRWRAAFREPWDSINARRGYGWTANPWVWVISFKSIKEAHNSLRD